MESNNRVLPTVKEIIAERKIAKHRRGEARRRRAASAKKARDKNLSARERKTHNLFVRMLDAKIENLMIKDEILYAQRRARGLVDAERYKEAGDVMYEINRKFQPRIRELEHRAQELDAEADALKAEAGMAIAELIFGMPE